MLRITITKEGFSSSMYMSTPEQTPEQFIDDIKMATPNVKRTHGPMNLIECKEKDISISVETSTQHLSSHYEIVNRIVKFINSRS